jgi:hypothetical protein
MPATTAPAKTELYFSSEANPILNHATLNMKLVIENKMLRKEQK